MTKIYFNADGSIRDIQNRELLISSSDGVNIIRAYTDDALANNARISFQRNDGFVISELVMTRVFTEENAQGQLISVNAYDLTLTGNLGVLAVKGELQTTVRFIKLTTDTEGNVIDEKTQACGLVVLHVYGSIDDGDDVKTPQQMQIDNLKDEYAKFPAMVEALKDQIVNEVLQTGGITLDDYAKKEEVYTKDEAEKRFDEVIPLVAMQDTNPTNFTDNGFRPTFYYNTANAEIMKYDTADFAWKSYGEPSIYVIYLYQGKHYRYDGSTLINDLSNYYNKNEIDNMIIGALGGSY